MLEVILKKDIYKLGDRGQVVKVANGYARNFLYPQQLAIPATVGRRESPAWRR
jgi:large subunit ribosomal protein L9